MIEFTKGYKTSDGKLVATINEAQLYELVMLLGGIVKNDEITTKESISKFILEYKDTIVDILTTTAKSKPKARSINGGTKKRPSKNIQKLQIIPSSLGDAIGND